MHNAILNRVECDDGTWRTLDSRALHRARAAASAIGGRVQDELISRTVLAAYEQRPDGHGRELTGVPQDAKEQFRSRRAVITAEVAELAAEYQARHGHPPNARALFAMAQFVTLNSRRAKPKRASAPTRAQQLAAWAEQMTRAELGTLDAIPDRVIGGQGTRPHRAWPRWPGSRSAGYWPRPWPRSRPLIRCGRAVSCSRLSMRSCPAGSAALTPPRSGR